MALQKASRSSAAQTMSLGRPGQPTSIEGYLVNVKEVTANEKPTKIYTFNVNGANQQVWGSRDLDDQMENVPTGCFVSAACTGQRKTPKGKMYTFDVGFDPDNVLDGYDVDDSFDQGDDDQVAHNTLAASQTRTESLLRKK